MSHLLIERNSKPFGDCDFTVAGKVISPPGIPAFCVRKWLETAFPQTDGEKRWIFNSLFGIIIFHEEEDLLLYLLTWS